MVRETLRRIGRRLGLERSSTRAAADRVAAECGSLDDAELIARGAEARTAGDLARAAALLQAAAERGIADAQHQFGEMLYNGEVPTQAFPAGEASYRMQRAAVRWLSAAADAGHPGAQARLGLIYLANSDAALRQRGLELVQAAAAVGHPLAVQHLRAHRGEA